VSVREAEVREKEADVASQQENCESTNVRRRRLMRMSYCVSLPSVLCLILLYFCPPCALLRVNLANVLFLFSSVVELLPFFLCAHRSHCSRSDRGWTTEN
jgi:uncharacterized membrane protein